MKLKHTRLCIDCSEVHDDYVCPACSSRAQFPIAAWLDRDPSMVTATAEVIELERIFRLKDV